MMKKRIMSILIALCMMVLTMLPAYATDDHTYYKQFGWKDRNGNELNGMCYFTSFAMLLTNLGKTITPVDVYYANGSMACDFNKLSNYYGLTYDVRRELDKEYGANEAKKRAVIISALESGKYPAGVLVCGNTDGTDHMVVARKVVNGIIYCDDPAIGCCIPIDQTQRVSSYITVYRAFSPNGNWNKAAGTSGNGNTTPNKNISVSSTTSGKWTVKIPSNYKLVCYDSANATKSSTYYIAAKTTPYPLNCTQQATLSNGKTRYFFVSGDGKNLWFDYTSSMSMSGSSATATSHTITFNANGGSTSQSSKTVTTGQKYGDLPVPSRDGYTFDGWYTSANGGTQITAAATVSLSGNQTLYAHWTKEPTTTYTVTFDPKGGYINPSTKSFPAGSEIGDLPTPTRNGYIFLGWSTAKEGSGMIVTPGSLIMTEDMTLYAVWKSQTVYFDANGGSTPQAAKNVTIGSVYGDLPIPTRSGYTFDGWYTSASGGTQITSSTIASGDAYITLYAHWSQIPQQDSGPSSFDSSGTFGQKNPFSWGLDSTTGTLVISGNGQMAGWQNAENRPWAKIRNKVTKVIIKDGAQNLSQYLVARCENMTSISIPESVTEICDGVFIRAYALESIQLPQGLTKIGGSAFSECTSLRSITIPENVNYIEAWAFSQCTNLQSIYFSGNAPSYFGDAGTSKLNMFSGCKNLTVYYPANSSGWTPIIEKYTDVTWKTWNPGNTSSSSPTPINSNPTWGTWSAWSSTPYNASSTRQVETQQVKVSDGHTEYRYGRYIDNTRRNICWCGKYLESLSYVTGSATLQYSSWTSSRFSTNGKAWTCGYCNGNHIGVDHYDSAGRPAWLQYVSPNGDSYYWEESRWVDATYETQYRYRDWIVD